jgi:hypothetical protein
MSYVRFADDTPWHPRVQSMSDAEFRAWFTSVCYASRFRTDGHIPDQAITLVAPRQKVREALIEAGTWEANGNGVYVHDYLQYQRSKAQIEAAIEAGRKGARGRWS